ncbi:MAG: hypothetical protein Q9213_001641 [Squamulea squamosa]
MSAGGLEYAAGVGGLISLSLTLFRGCVQGFEIIQRAAHAGSEADNFRCKLEVEQYRLIQWAEQIGLEDQPSERLNWTLVRDILKQMEALLLDPQNLRKRYRLNLVPVESDASAPETSSPPETGFGKLLSKLRPDFPLASSRIIHESNGTIRKLRWAVFDRTKAATLVIDIVHFNNCLHNLLNHVNQEFVKSAVGSVLRDIISRSNATSELKAIKQLLNPSYVAVPAAVASAASLKQIRLVPGLGPSLDSVGQPTQRAPPEGIKIKLFQLKPNLLHRQPSRLSPCGRELARYKTKPVVVEWKFINSEHEKELKTRIDQIAILLAHTYDASRWEFSNANGPFLAGYEYARPTTAHTEAMPAIPEQEMYRHPKGQGLTRANFRRSFDLFALGCVLLEIGLWCDLLNVLQQVPFESTQQGHRDSISKTPGIRPGKVDWVHLQTAKTQLLQNDNVEKRTDLAGIAFHAGKIFQGVILLCLYAYDSDPLDEDISVQKEIVDLLRQAKF